MSLSGLSGLGLGGRCGCHRGGDKLGAGRAAGPRAGGDSRPRGAGHGPPALPFSEGPGAGPEPGEAQPRGGPCPWQWVSVGHGAAFRFSLLWFTPFLHRSAGQGNCTRSNGA